MPRFPRALPAVAFGLAVAVLAAVTVPAVHAETRSFPGGKVRIHNLIGRATIVQGTGTGFKIDITRGGDDAAELEIRSEREGDVEVLRIVFPGDRFVYPALGMGSNSTISVNSDGTFGGSGRLDRRQVRVSGGGSGKEMWADLRIEMPKGGDLKLHNAIGKVAAEGISGDLDLDTASGDVEATGITGDITVDVGSGDVELTRIEGTISVDTGSGNVILTDVSGDMINADTGSGDIEGDHVRCDQLAMDTGSGDITMDAVAVSKISCDTGSGSILVAIEGDLEGGNFDTGSGDVTLEVGPDLGASLDIETGSGDIDIDTPHQATRNRRSEFRGTVGDGKGNVIIETGSGDVRVTSAR
jgi:hypothetical protein